MVKFCIILQGSCKMRRKGNTLAALLGSNTQAYLVLVLHLLHDGLSHRLGIRFAGLSCRPVLNSQPSQTKHWDCAKSLVPPNFPQRESERIKHFIDNSKALFFSTSLLMSMSIKFRRCLCCCMRLVIFQPCILCFY